MDYSRSKTSKLWYPIDALGHHAMRRVYLLVESIELILKAFWVARLNPQSRHSGVTQKILEQIYLIAIKRSFLVVLSLAMISGALVVGFVSPQAMVFGEQNVMGQAIVLLIALELAPLLISIVMISRSATVICTELAIKRLHGELDDDAPELFSAWVYPSVVGGLVSMACLTFCFVIVAYFSGYLMMFMMHNTPLPIYISLVFDAMQTFTHWLVLIIKVMADAIIIFSFACLGGLQAEKKSQGVAHANAFVVRYCFSYVIFFNALISVVYYALSVVFNLDVI